MHTHGSARGSMARGACRPVPQPALPLCPCPPSAPAAGGAGRAAAGAGRAEHHNLCQPQVWCVAWPASLRGCLACMWALCCLCCTRPSALTPSNLRMLTLTSMPNRKNKTYCRQDEALLVPPGKEGAHPRTGGPAVAARCPAAARDPARHAAGGCLSPSFSCCIGWTTQQWCCLMRSWCQPLGAACRTRQLSCWGYYVRRTTVC